MQQSRLAFLLSELHSAALASIAHADSAGINHPHRKRRVIKRGSINTQRGLSEAQNGYGFGMLPGHGRPDGQFSSLALDGSPACKLFIAPELENCPSGRPCAMGRGVNPTFHSQMSTPDHPLHQITCFLVF